MTNQRVPKETKNVHMMDGKDQLQDPLGFQGASSCLLLSVLKLSSVIYHLSVDILYLIRTYDCLTSWF
jgi:hypothetical protein